MTTQARVAAVVLAVLAALAAYNTAYVVAAVVREPGPGLLVAAAAAVGVTSALGWAATRMWRRGDRVR